MRTRNADCDAASAVYPATLRRKADGDARRHPVVGEGPVPSFVVIGDGPRRAQVPPLRQPGYQWQDNELRITTRRDYDAPVNGTRRYDSLHPAAIT